MPESMLDCSVDEPYSITCSNRSSAELVQYALLLRLLFERDGTLLGFQVCPEKNDTALPEYQNVPFFSLVDSLKKIMA